MSAAGVSQGAQRASPRDGREADAPMVKCGRRDDEADA
jgi:hypothetical protein